MFDDDNDDFLTFMMGVFFLGPWLVCLWIKATFALLEIVFHVVAGVVMFFGYVIKGSYDWIKKLWKESQ